MPESVHSTTDANKPGGDRLGSLSAIVPEKRLQLLCEGIIELLKLKELHGEKLSLKVSSLFQMLDEGGRDAARQLRNEIISWDAADKQLQQLANVTLMPLGDDIRALRDKLARVRRQATQVVDLLESGTSSPFECEKEVSAISDCGPFAVSTRVVAPPCEIDTVVEDIPSADRNADSKIDRETITPPSPRILSDAEIQQTTILLQNAQAKRDIGDLASSECLYTQAIEINPELRSAWLHRGRIRLLNRQPQCAIDDLSIALRLDGADPIAYGWRGDALAMTGRLSDAIEDYDQALRLRSDLFVTRYNRAVALRQRGYFDKALEEFNELARIKPKQGTLYLNRGLIFFERGYMARAATEFRMALKYQPGSQEAAEKLREAASILKAERPSSTIGTQPLITHRSGAAQKCASTKNEILLCISKPTIVKASTEDSESLAATSESIAAECRLPCECPVCGKKSIIRWNVLKVGKVLACPHCQRNLSADETGHLFEVVKEQDGQWVNLEAKREQLRQAKLQRRRWMMGIATSIAFIICCYSLPRIVSTSQAGPPPLPPELESRAELFATAWLEGNYSLMRRLTDPAQDRLLFVWSRRNPPPLECVPVAGQKEVRFAVKVVQNHPTLASLEVCSKVDQAGNDKSPVALKLAWEKRGGSWIFQPNPSQRTSTPM